MKEIIHNNTIRKLGIIIPTFTIVYGLFIHKSWNHMNFIF